MPGSQIAWCGRIKTSKAKIRRERLARFSHFFLLNDFSPLYRSLEQATKVLAVFLVLVFHPSPQINVGRDEKRAPLKTPAWEATKAARIYGF